MTTGTSHFGAVEGAMAAVAKKNAEKRITDACGATIRGLVNAVESDLP
jgi:hypothetical protein